MDKKPRITLTIPDEGDFDELSSRVGVPELVVASTIDTPQAMLAQWRAEVGSIPDERIWAALMTAQVTRWAGSSLPRRGDSPRTAPSCSSTISAGP